MEKRDYNDIMVHISHFSESNYFRVYIFYENERPVSVAHDKHFQFGSVSDIE